MTQIQISKQAAAFILPILEGELEKWKIFNKEKPSVIVKNAVEMLEVIIKDINDKVEEKQ